MKISKKKAIEIQAALDEYAEAQDLCWNAAGMVEMLTDREVNPNNEARQTVQEFFDSHTLKMDGTEFRGTVTVAEYPTPTVAEYFASAKLGLELETGQAQLILEYLLCQFPWLDSRLIQSDIPYPSGADAIDQIEAVYRELCREARP